MSSWTMKRSRVASLLCRCGSHSLLCVVVFVSAPLAPNARGERRATRHRHPELGKKPAVWPVRSTARSFWIPGSWHLRIVYTNAIPFLDPRQEPNGAGQYPESDR
jgi:hypothetical protein